MKNKKPWAKAIRDATGLSVADFCKTYLNCNMAAFRLRDYKGILNPNEVLLICLISGRNPKDLFGSTAFEMFLLRGNEAVSGHIKEILKQPDAREKLNLILGNPEGLRIPVLIDPPKQKLEKKARAAEKPKRKPVLDDDFVDAYN